MRIAASTCVAIVVGLATAVSCNGTDVLAPPIGVPAAGITAFVNVTVIPMTGVGPMSAQTVVVRNDVIESMGDTATVTIPAGATIVDGTGRFLMPGLIDMHSHLGTNYSEFTNRRPPEDELQEMAEGQLLLYLANGVTTIVGNGDFGEPLPRWAGDVVEGRYPGPTVHAAIWVRGPADTPDGGPPSRSVTGPEQAVSHITAAKDAGYEFVKIYNWTPAAALPAICATAKSLGMGVIGHFPQTAPTADALADGLDLVAHAEAWFWRFFDFRVQPDRVAQMAALARDAGAAVTTTLEMSATTAQVWGDNAQGIAAFWSRPENRYMHWTEVALHREGIEGPRWNPPGSRPGGLDDRIAFVRSYTRALHDAGVPLLAGTDAPTVLGVAGFSLHRELEELQHNLGFSPREVLEIATRNPGTWLGRFLAGRPPVGIIVAGARADLLLLEADPLADIHNVARRAAVMARGRLYPESELQAGLERIAALYAGNCCPD